MLIGLFTVKLFRTEEEDFVFGPAQLLPLPAALQWEVGDTVQVRVDHEEFQQYHQHHQQQDLSSFAAHDSNSSSGAGNGRKEGSWEEGEGWVEGTVWAVHADQRYTVKINATGQVRICISIVSFYYALHSLCVLFSRLCCCKTKRGLKQF